jgi:hypothetical protein
VDGPVMKSPPAKRFLPSKCVEGDALRALIKSYLILGFHIHRSPLKIFSSTFKKFIPDWVYYIFEIYKSFSVRNP